MERHIDRRFFSLFVTLVLLVPVLICVINDLFVDDRISWSVFVIAGAALLFVFIFLPFILGKCSPWLLWAIDMVAVLGFLFLVDFHGWTALVFPLALPLTIVLSLVCFLLWWFKIRRPILKSMGLLCYAAGLYAMCGRYHQSL